MLRAMLLPNDNLPQMKRVGQLWSILKSGYIPEPSTAEEIRAVRHSGFTMLYDITEMIGFPWLDPLNKSKINEEMAKMSENQLMHNLEVGSCIE